MRSVPVYIICHNNGWLVQDTIEALGPYTEQFVVLDNASRDRATRGYLHGLSSDHRVRVVNLPQNLGPRCFYLPMLWDGMPEFFAVTDPDLAYPATLPPNFINELGCIADIGGVFKAGLALDISGPPEQFEIYQHVVSERRYWDESLRVPAPASFAPMYMAPIDTTFAVYCKRNYKTNMFGPSLRVAGPFTAQHRPWYKAFWQNNADQLRATYDGAVYSTTGKHMADALGIAPIDFVPWRASDLHPEARPAPTQPGT